MPSNLSREALTETRLAWHTVAEHVLAATRYAATGRIGLRPAPNGVTTPPFPTNAGDTAIAIVGVDLVVHDGDGERRAPISTLQAAGQLVGITPGAPSELYTPATPLDLEREMVVDADAARALADWYGLIDQALARLRKELAGDEPTIVQLWPEHFDMSTAIGPVNYGGSPGDASHPEPYLYVGPFDPPTLDDPAHRTGYWNEPFGASQPWTEVDGVGGALAFYREGRSRLADAGG